MLSSLFDIDKMCLHWCSCSIFASHSESFENWFVLRFFYCVWFLLLALKVSSLVFNFCLKRRPFWSYPTVNQTLMYMGCSWFRICNCTDYVFSAHHSAHKRWISSTTSSKQISSCHTKSSFTQSTKLREIIKRVFTISDRINHQAKDKNGNSYSNIGHKTNARKIALQNYF